MVGAEIGSDLLAAWRNYSKTTNRSENTTGCASRCVGGRARCAGWVYGGSVDKRPVVRVVSARPAPRRA
jgi:hypothetical protein